MEGVEKLRQDMKEAFEEFSRIQEEKQQFMEDFHNSVMEILVKEISSFRANLEAYLEMRNENLHVTLKNMDECLNQASAAHSDIADYRMQLMQACNHNIQPPFTAPEEDILVNGQGIKDLQNISSEAEQCVMQISEVQNQACTLMNTLWEDILQKVSSTMMSEAVVQMKKYDEGRLRKAQEVYQRGNEELNKATQVLENIDKVKKQIECLCQMFKEPEN